ncbi:MAG TPA: SDR family NAD(P)-dependent oxidoreductase [Nitriliruptorales bacterium]
MAGRLDGRVVIVTGAGRGLGREHALLLASEGARVVVNDLGGDVTGEGADVTPAQTVVKEIEQAGGEAVVSGHDVADWDQAGQMVQLAIDTFGELHVLVNNAGILRDRTIHNMTPEEWDAVVRVHLRGHAAPTHHAVKYWRQRAKDGDPVDRPALVHTTSASGFIGNFGQANYGSAKMGVLALSQIARLEGAGYGLRSNAVGPAAATRMSGTIPGREEVAEDDPRAALLHPGNVSPIVAWLAAADCPANGQVFHVYGNRVIVLETARPAADLRSEGRWTLEELDRQLPPNLVEPPSVAAFLPTEDDLG